MKKVIMLLAVAAILASCQSAPNKKAENNSDSLVMEVKSTPSKTAEIYQGTLPAADGPGINYVLALNAIINGSDTVYTLDMTYLDAEGPGKNQTFTSKGKQERFAKTVDKQTKRAIKLTPDNGEAPTFLIIVNDTTLRLVNENLEEMESNLNYDIVKVKNAGAK